MLIGIDEMVLQKYPQAEIGYLLARVSVQKSDPFVEELKKDLKNYLVNQDITATNYVSNPNIAVWRKIYENDFSVKAKTYRSSLEALLKRIITGKSIWNISNIVDLYNCCSIFSLLPMGGYDLNKIKGNMKIRFAKDKEPFLGLGEKEIIETNANQVVYADNERIMCWLWNHKDCIDTCIDENTEYVLFFIDSFDHDKLQKALHILEKNLEKINCEPMKSGILNSNSSQASIDLKVQ